MLLLAIAVIYCSTLLGEIKGKWKRMKRKIGTECGKLKAGTESGNGKLKAETESWKLEMVVRIENPKW